MSLMAPLCGNVPRIPSRYRLLGAVLVAGILFWPAVARAGHPWDEMVDLNGKRHRPWDSADTKAVVLVFTNVDCPIANYYQPELRRLHQKYAPRGVRFFQVHSDPAVTPQMAREHVRQYRIPMPVVMDPKQRLARAVQAKVTPEAFVIDRQGRVVYRGRIDDTYVDYGRKRPRPRHRDLAEALDALLGGKPVPRRQTQAVGCLIVYDEP